MKVKFRAGFQRQHSKPRDSAAQKPASRVARMLAMAYAIEQSIDNGKLRDYAHAAELLGGSRPRMTQVMGLLNLAAGIQEAILSGELVVSERRVRTVASETCWEAQGKDIA